jgi:two-component system, sensor histidine kinase ChiS
MKGKILVVDDEPQILDGLKALLAADYYNVVTAKTGKEAVNAFRKESPDLVILDVVLPDFDGFEILKKIKKDMKDKYIPVIFLTASVDMESKVKAFHSGAVDYLTKPFSTAELLVRIESFLNIKKQHDMLKEDAIYDKMTGVLNKVHFMQRAGEEIRKGYIYRKILAFIIVDIDNFKQINDSFGHLAGDQVIVNVGARIKDVVRPTDVFGRFGGDEFTFLLPNTDAKGASVIAKRLISEIETHPVVYEKDKIKLSISIGIADTYKRNIQELEDLVKLADEALYKAKKEKGNSFAIA